MKTARIPLEILLTLSLQAKSRRRNAPVTNGRNASPGCFQNLHCIHTETNLKTVEQHHERARTHKQHTHVRAHGHAHPDAKPPTAIKNQRNFKIRTRKIKIMKTARIPLAILLT